MQPLANIIKTIADTINYITDAEISEARVGNWAMGIFYWALITGAILLCRKLFLIRLKKLTKATKNRLDDTLSTFLENINILQIVATGILISWEISNLPDLIGKRVLLFALVASLTWQLASLASNLTTESLLLKSKLSGHDHISSYDNSVNQLFALIAKILVWIVGGVWAFNFFGINWSTVVASLGVGSIVLAFALQNILADIFASFSIYFDRPFAIGDFVEVDTYQGTVKNIGFKSTRIQTLQGEELVISNKQLTESKIQNYKRMERRRIVFNLGFAYSTTSQQLRTINSIVKDIIAELSICQFDRCHFYEFGPYSLNYEIVYYINSSDYATYMDIQQKINLELKQKLEEEGIQIAFPTQTINIQK